MAAWVAAISTTDRRHEIRRSHNDFINPRFAGGFLLCCGSGSESAQPPGTENHRQRQKDGQGRPGDAIEGCFGAAGTRERGTAAGGKSTHAIALGAVQQHKQNQQQSAADPDPGENGCNPGVILWRAVQVQTG